MSQYIMNYLDSVNEGGLRHYANRSVGQAFIRMPKDSRHVMNITMNDMQFKSSEEAQQFLRYMNTKYSNQGELCGARRLKLASIASD
jgi:hypothetical protein